MNERADLSSSTSYPFILTDFSPLNRVDPFPVIPCCVSAIVFARVTRTSYLPLCSNPISFYPCRVYALRLSFGCFPWHCRMSLSLDLLTDVSTLRIGAQDSFTHGFQHTPEKSKKDFQLLFSPANKFLDFKRRRLDIDAPRTPTKVQGDDSEIPQTHVRSQVKRALCISTPLEHPVYLLLQRLPLAFVI